MLKKEELEFLSEQLKKYYYHYDEIVKASEVLSQILEEVKVPFMDKENVIAYHDSRIKTPNSYLNKLLKNYREDKIITYDDMHDIVATRLVCLNLSDINEFVKLLRECNKINILEERDYIYHPKKSGYRSYHMIIEVPFVDNDGVETKVKTEIQLRTILMDIFAREEHKLGYKNNGTIPEEDKKALKELSEELYYFDTSLDKMVRPTRNEFVDDSEELKIVEEEFNKTSNMYEIIYNDLDSIIKEFHSQYSIKDDILHINSRIKPVSSIKRKLTKKKLSYTSESILYGLKDVIGYKIVCTDINTVKHFIEYFNGRINDSDKIKIKEVSDHLDEAKDSGYRGYKINIEYCPEFLIEKPITVEILIRTMVQDAWALQQDARIYNKEERYAKKEEYIENGRSLKGLSHALHHVEMALNELKEQNKENKLPAKNLVKEVKEYNISKKLVLNKKDEE